MSYSPYNFGNPMSQQQPSGTVYLVNSFNEAANIPQGFGTTINLCLNDNIMYMRNNNNILAYKLTPYEPPKPNTQQNIQMDERLSNVEKQLQQILDFLNGSASSNKQQETQPKRGWDV